MCVVILKCFFYVHYFVKICFNQYFLGLSLMIHIFNFIFFVFIYIFKCLVEEDFKLHFGILVVYIHQFTRVIIYLQ
jgi:hypothetical protein